MQNTKNTCDKAKKISWAYYKEKINSVEAANTFRKIIESSTRHTLGTLEKTDGTITEPGTETLEYLLTQHFPSSTPVKPTDYNNRSITREEINAFQPDWVTPEKVREAFHGFQSKKSPGTDGLKPIILKHLPTDILNFITSLYKALLLLEFTPTKWKECRMIFIPKPGKPSYKIAKAWRPISLTNLSLIHI